MGNDTYRIIYEKCQMKHLKIGDIIFNRPEV